MISTKMKVMGTAHLWRTPIKTATWFGSRWAGFWAPKVVDFYGQLHDKFNTLPSYDIKLLIGDFNAQLDGNKQGLEQVIGPFGSVGKNTENGKRLFLFCTHCHCEQTERRQHLLQAQSHSQGHLAVPGQKTRNEIDYICIWKPLISPGMDVNALLLTNSIGEDWLNYVPNETSRTKV